VEYAAWKLFTDAAELGSLSKVAVAYGTSQRISAAGSANWSRSVEGACSSARVEGLC
jgi:hypothetical protein